MTTLAPIWAGTTVKVRADFLNDQGAADTPEGVAFVAEWPGGSETKTWPGHADASNPGTGTVTATFQTAGRPGRWRVTATGTGEATVVLKTAFDVRE